MLRAIINKVKEKKPLDRLDDSYVKKYVLQFLEKNPKIRKKLEGLDNKLEKNKQFKETVKGVRNELNKSYGVFWQEKKELLDKHKSTEERKTIYPQLYKRIFAITGIPKSILDLGCGLNPLSYPQMSGFKGQFIATELSKEDCKQIKEIFKKLGIKGKVLQVNLLEVKSIPKTELCFLFKMLDVLDVKGHKFSEELLLSIPSKKLVVSFSTKDLKGMKMKHPRRGWFERMCKRLEWRFDKLEFENEIFYIIEKN